MVHRLLTRRATTLVAAFLIAALAGSSLHHAPASAQADVGRPDLPRPLGPVGGATNAILVLGDRALVGNGRELRAFDLEPGPPVRATEVSATDPLDGPVRRIRAEGDLLAVAAGPALRLFRARAFDEAPAEPIGGLRVGSRIEDLQLRDRIAYLAAGAEGLLVVDVSEPARPEILGRLAPPADRELYRVALPADGEAVALVGRLDRGSRRHFEVEARWLDVADPTSPRTMAALPLEPDGARALSACHGDLLLGARPTLHRLSRQGNELSLELLADWGGPSVAEEIICPEQGEPWIYLRLSPGYPWPTAVKSLRLDLSTLPSDSPTPVRHGFVVGSHERDDALAAGLGVWRGHAIDVRGDGAILRIDYEEAARDPEDFEPPILARLLPRLLALSSEPEGRALAGIGPGRYLALEDLPGSEIGIQGSAELDVVARNVSLDRGLAAIYGYNGGDVISDYFSPLVDVRRPSAPQLGDPLKVEIGAMLPEIVVNDGRLLRAVLSRRDGGEGECPLSWYDSTVQLLAIEGAQVREEVLRFETEGSVGGLAMADDRIAFTEYCDDADGERVIVLVGDGEDWRFLSSWRLSSDPSSGVVRQIALTGDELLVARDRKREWREPESSEILRYRIRSVGGADLLGRTLVPGTVADIEIDEARAYVGWHRYGNSSWSTDDAGGIAVLDLPSEDSPRYLGSLPLPGPARSVAVGGDRLYAAAGDEGLWVFAREPTLPWWRLWLPSLERP